MNQAGFYGFPTPFGGQIYPLQYTTVQLFPQQNYYNQNLFNNKETFKFKKHTEPFNWKLASAMDVNKIIQKGDISSVKFCIREFMDAYVDKNDKQHFPSDDMYNAFRVMQLGLSYLSSENDSIKSQIDEITAVSNEEAMNQMKDKFEQSSKIIQEKDEIIENLQSRIAQLEESLKEDQTKIHALRQKLHHTRQINTQLRGRLEDTEEGLAHTETARRQFNSMRRRLKH